MRVQPGACEVCEKERYEGYSCAHERECGIVRVEFGSGGSGEGMREGVMLKV
jgi:hypothetical protein